MQTINYLVTVFLFLLLFPEIVVAYNSDWNYKNPIIINNTQNSNNLFDYQIFINISYMNGMKSNFSDLRFTWFNSTSNNELPISYFVENYKNNSFAEIWIKLPKIHANNYETIYMYYGNPSANSESNPDTTLELYDNFDNYTSIADTTFQNIYSIFVSGGYINLVDDGNGGLEVEVMNSGSQGWQGGTLQTKEKYSCAKVKFDYKIKPRTFRDISFHYGFADRQAYDFWQGRNYMWFGQWFSNDFDSTMEINNETNLQNEQRILFDINATNKKRSMIIDRCYPYVIIYVDNNLKNKTINLSATPSKPLQFSFGMQAGASYNSYAYLDNLLIAKFSYTEPTYTIGNESGNAGTNMVVNIPPSIKADNIFSSNIRISDSQNNPISNLSSSDFRIFRDYEQTDFTDFRNFNNGTYSLNISSGNIIGNVSFSMEANGAFAEAFAYVSIKPKNSAVIIAGGWENILLAGLTGKPVFANYSETEKYYFSKIQPEQVFVFENLTADYPTYKFKSRRAFIETFYGNETAILVSNKEQAVAAAPFAKLKNFPLLFDTDGTILSGFNSILNLSAKNPDEIAELAIKEFSKSGRNINTIIVANPQTETSALAGALAAKHNAIILPMNFTGVSYPETVSDFYALNGANGVLRIKQKLNETIKRLSDNFLFSNSIDYKIGRVQLNLVLLGNASEVPQPAVFDPGREMFFDYDKNYLLTDFPYSDANSDGKADMISGRIVSPYQLVELKKENRIVTAALYRNFETVFSGNGLIESQTTDAAFRTAGFETIRLIENRTGLSEYEITFGYGNATDFLKKLFSDLSITESLKLLNMIYGGYNEFLEHNYYNMMASLKLNTSGLTIKMLPDERLTKDSLLAQMQGADGIFYYGNGAGGWQTESFFGDKIYFDEFPATSSAVYDERTNSARLPEKTVFEKGASAFIGSSGIVYNSYSFMPNARFASDAARNKSLALALENSRYPLLPSQIKNLAAALHFNYQPERDLSIKQFLQMVCYCDPERKIDPDVRESGTNPTINHSVTFKSRIRIPINYVVSGNRIFFDSESYLQELGKPVVPMYSAETILPNGSKIIGTSFNYNLSRYENISADFAPVYGQFNQPEDAHGFYPSQMFYSEVFDLLDGRKSVKMIAAGMQYNNDTKEALVLDDAEAVIEYASPFEFTEFSAANIALGSNQAFKIRSFGTQNLSAVIDIRSGSFSDTIKQEIPSGFSEISWKPPFSGDFSATAYILMGNNSAGPRYASFSIKPHPFVFFKSIESFGANGYEMIMKGFAEKMRFAFGGAAAVVEYVNPFSKLSSAANSSAIEKRISSPDYSFSVAQDSGKIVYMMKDSRGELVLEKNAGATKETCRGDCSGLYGKMDSKISEMNVMQDFVVENIGR